MPSNKTRHAVDFSISSCFIIISLSFAVAAALFLENMGSMYFFLPIIIAVIFGMIGSYLAFRAVQNMLSG